MGFRVRLGTITGKFRVTGPGFDLEDPRVSECVLIGASTFFCVAFPGFRATPPEAALNLFACFLKQSTMDPVGCCFEETDLLEKDGIGFSCSDGREAALTLAIVHGLGL